MIPLLALAAALANPAPSASATALSAKADLSIGFAKSPSIEETAKAISQDLLHSRAAWHGPPCDQTDARCRAAADKVGREFAPAIAAAYRARANFLVALAADAHMSSTEMKTAETFLSSAAGRHFVDMLNALSDPKQASADFAKVIFNSAGPPLTGPTAYIDRFYEITADLPRDTHTMIAPPPPPMPSRSPK